MKKTPGSWNAALQQIKSTFPLDYIIFTQMPEYWLQAALMLRDTCGKNKKDVTGNCLHSLDKGKVSKG